MIYKLAEWFEKEHNIDSYISHHISFGICGKIKQANEDTKIVKWKRCFEIVIPSEVASNISHEDVIITTKKEVWSKEYRTFPFIAPYCKPKKTWIEENNKFIRTTYHYNDKRTIKMEPFYYQDHRLTVYIFAGYDPMKDVLYINCEVNYG